MSALLPIFLDLKDKPVLLVGGGSAALEKLEKLVKTGAKVKIVAKHFQAPTIKLIESLGLDFETRDFQLDDLDHKFLVISAVNDPKTHQILAEYARQKGILVNTVDEPGSCDFYFAAQIERGPLQFAISSGGLFPGLARSIRLWIEEQFPESITDDLNQLTDIRQKVKEQIPSQRERMQALREQLQIWLDNITPKKAGEKS